MGWYSETHKLQSLTFQNKEYFDEDRVAPFMEHLRNEVFQLVQRKVRAEFAEDIDSGQLSVLLDGDFIGE